MKLLGLLPLSEKTPLAGTNINQNNNNQQDEEQKNETKELKLEIRENAQIPWSYFAEFLDRFFLYLHVILTVFVVVFTSC